MEINKKIIAMFLMIVFSGMNFGGISFASVSNQPVLAMLETGLDSSTSKEGDQFIAEIMEDLLSENKTVIPKQSNVYGSVIKVKRPGAMSKDAYISLKITKIKTPDEKILSIEEKPIIIQVIPLVSKGKKGDLIKKLPGSVANTATSIVINRYCSFAYPAVWAIGTGAGMAVSAASGVVFPDANKSRRESSASRAIGSTPVGYANYAFKKGENFSIESGQYINISFDMETIQYIKNL